MTIAKQKNTIEKTPLIVFIVTFFIGLLLLIFSISSQSLVPEIFEAGSYPEPTPPSNDPPCPDDDDDDDDDPSPTPPPSSEPSPTPPSYECTGLGPQPDNPQRGDTLTFTCTSTATDATIDHYNFRVNGGSDQRVDTNDSQATYSFTIPETGNGFNVQCQVCISDTDCTAWGQAN